MKKTKKKRIDEWLTELNKSWERFVEKKYSISSLVRIRTQKHAQIEQFKIFPPITGSNKKK